jgi:hypothetical protein
MTMPHDTFILPTSHALHAPRPGRRHWLVLATTGALTACANPFGAHAPHRHAHPDVTAGIVSVTYGDPAQFSDARAGSHETGPARRAWLDTLSEHLAEQAAPTLPKGQRLEVHLSDVKRAGGFEAWRGPQASQLRVVRDVYPPRIDLQFKRLAADGRVLQSGTRQLRDPNFLARPSRYANDVLRHEKTLLDDWLAQEFGAPR